MDTRIGFSNLLDLDRFFFAVRDTVYVVIKLDENFPNYYRGSDIDVFCYDRAKFARCILSVGNHYLNQDCKIEVDDHNETHTYVDFYFEDELDFRFDLYEALPDYENIKLKKHYICSVIENASKIYREFDGVTYLLYVPSIVDDLLLRYVEYVEWYKVRPDKIKHLNYIAEVVSENNFSRIRMLDKLHRYTELPTPSSERPLWQRFYWFRWLRYWMKKIRSVPLRRIPQIAWRKLCQRLSSLFII